MILAVGLRPKHCPQSVLLLQQVLILMMTRHVCLNVEGQWCGSQSPSKLARPVWAEWRQISAELRRRSWLVQPRSAARALPHRIPGAAQSHLFARHKHWRVGTTQLRHQTHSGRTTKEMLWDSDQNLPTKTNIAFRGESRLAWVGRVKLFGAMAPSAWKRDWESEEGFFSWWYQYLANDNVDSVPLISIVIMTNKKNW